MNIKITRNKPSVGASAPIQIQQSYINYSPSITEGSRVLGEAQNLLAQGRVYDSWQKLGRDFIGKEELNNNDPVACQAAIKLGINILSAKVLDPKMSLDQQLELATDLLSWKNSANPKGVIQPRDPNNGNYGDILNIVNDIAKLAPYQNKNDLAAKAVELLTVHHYAFTEGTKVLTEGAKVVGEAQNLLAQGRVYDSWQKLGRDFMCKEGINNNDPEACQAAIQLGIDILHKGLSSSPKQPMTLEQKLELATALLNWKNPANPNGLVQPRDPNSGSYGDILSTIHHGIAEIAQSQHNDELAAKAVELLTLHHYPFTA